MANDTAAFREMAAAMRSSTGFNAATLKYTKSKWSVGDIDFDGRELTARVDWTMVGWTKWWERKPVDYRLGYVADRFVPPARAELGNLNRDEWDIYCKGRDPWVFSWILPLFDAASGEAFLWSTDSRGGRDAIANLLTAYADRVEANPEEKKTLPIVELATGGYAHAQFGFVHTPELNILDWAEPAPISRPQLPAPATTKPTTPLLPSLEAPEAPETSEAASKQADGRHLPFDDALPF